VASLSLLATSNGLSSITLQPRIMRATDKPVIVGQVAANPEEASAKRAHTARGRSLVIHLFKLSLFYTPTSRMHFVCDSDGDSDINHDGDDDDNSNNNKITHDHTLYSQNLGSTHA
jgi:hypothetical protein